MNEIFEYYNYKGVNSYISNSEKNKIISYIIAYNCKDYLMKLKDILPKYFGNRPLYLEVMYDPEYSNYEKLWVDVVFDEDVSFEETSEMGKKFEDEWYLNNLNKNVSVDYI